MGKKILVVDDASSIRQVVCFALKDAGYETIEAFNGADALTKLDGREIDLVVCDVNMPELNGIDFLTEVKNNTKYSSYKFIPFIMLTTESADDLKEKGRAAGAKAWLIKPFQPKDLIEAVKKLVS